MWEKEAIIEFFEDSLSKTSFPTWRLDPLVGIFLSPMNTNDGFYLS